MVANVNGLTGDYTAST